MRQPAIPGCVKGERFSTVATGVFILAAIVPSVGPVPAAEPSASEPARLRGLLPDDVELQVVREDSPEELSDRHALLNQLIYRLHRRERRDIEQALQEIESGRPAEALACLQRLLDLPEDGFVWIGSRPDPVSVRGEASRILSSLEADVLQLYEEIHGAQAGRLLAEARQTNDPSRYREVNRRFFHTAAGFSAGDWLAGRALDRGRFATAARIWSRLLSEPSHRKRVTPTLLLKAAVAHWLTGQTDRCEELLTRIGEQPLCIAGRTENSASWLQRLVENRESPGDSPSSGDVILASASGPVVMGDARRKLSSNASAPYMRPAWSKSFSRSPQGLSEQFLRGWRERCQETSQAFAVANSAIVAGDTVLVRDFEGIRALDLSTGETLWTFTCESSLEKLAAESAQRAGSSNLATSGSLVVVQRAYVWNSTMGMLASDGQRVYAIDGMDLALRHSRRRRSFSVRDIGLSGMLRPILRQTNRLIAIEIDSPRSGEATNKEPVWSAGGAPPMADWFFRMDYDGDGAVTQYEFAGPQEKFEALDANGDRAVDPSEVEAADGADSRGRVLAGHFFLGPPLPVDGCLYAVTESDRQLNLVALRADTGKLVWSQGIGFVSLPIDVDTRRYPLSCSPSFADGVLVCPTQLGMLVAVDALTGSLLWANCCTDRQPEVLRRSPHLSSYSYGHAGFPNLPQIRNGKILYMPRQSRFIHCVDLFTGHRIWKAARRNPVVVGHSGAGDEYIAAVTDEIVMVAGGEYCRGLSLSTGEERWSARLGMPAGRGITVGDKYLLPLEEGRIATLDLATGREVGFSLVHAEETPDALWRPGNLAAGGNMIISAGMQQITALPQALPLLAKVRDRLEEHPRSIPNLLLASELELTLQDTAGAKSHLRSALASATDDRQRQLAETLMRELLCLELKIKSRSESAIFEQLDRYAKKPPERGRYLVLFADYQMRHGDREGILRSTGEFADLDLQSPLPMNGDPTHLVTPASWVPSVLGRAQERFGEAELAGLGERINAAQRAALASGEIGPLERFLAAYARRPQAVPVRMELANRLIERGCFQHAELLLLENRRCGDPRAAAAATERLLRLWDRLGLHLEAASLLFELEEQYGDVRLADGKTGRQHAAEFPRECLTATAYRRAKPPGWPVARVNISERHWPHDDPKLRESYRQNRGRFSSPHFSPFQLLYQGTSRSGELAVVDKHSGVLLGHVSIPSSNSNPSYSRDAYVGHFFPLGGAAVMNGISLLERHEDGPLWSTVLEDCPKQQDAMRVGPAGPSFCTFQAKSHLVLVDPACGRILWQRTDLDPHNGLNANRDLGVFGDEEVLVVVSADRSKHTVYRTVTGEKLQHGKLDVDARQPRHAFGRKLFYVSTSTDERRLRCWDPLDDSIVLDEPLYEPKPNHIFLAATPDKNQLAVILKEGCVRIIDGRTAQTRLEFPLEPDDLTNLNSMWAFRDHARYYVNLQRPTGNFNSPKYDYFDKQSYLSGPARLHGDVYAVDCRTGKLLWKRTFPQRSIIETPHLRLPFLIAISRQNYRDPKKQRQQSLLVEVIDAKTGRTIGLKDNIYPDRILQLWYEERLGRVQLTGLQTQIRLDFDRPRQCLLPHNGPL